MGKSLFGTCEPDSIGDMALDHRMEADDDLPPRAMLLVAWCRGRLVQGTAHTGGSLPHLVSYPADYVSLPVLIG